MDSSMLVGKESPEDYAYNSEDDRKVLSSALIKFERF